MSVKLMFTKISIHGVKLFAVRSDLSKLEKVAWACTVIMASILISISLVSLYSLLKLDPSTTVVQSRVEKMIFPAVTACNRGKYRQSVVNTVPTFASMAAALSQINTQSTIVDRKKRNLPNSYNSANMANVAEPELQLVGTEAYSQPQRSLIIAKRSITGTCASCVYYGGLCFIYVKSLSNNMNYPGAKSLCQSAGGSLPTFKSQAEITAFASLKYGQTPACPTLMYNYAGYVRNGTSWMDEKGSLLPNTTYFTNDYGDLSNYTCLAVGCNGHLSAYPCLPYSNPIGFEVYCNCPLLCPLITIPTNTIAQNLTFEPNSNVTFTCAPGWSINGSSYITCNAPAYGSVRWSSAPPICTQSACPPLNLTNQITNSTNTNLASQTGFSCPNGLDLFGPTVVSCIPNGTQAIWSSDPPICTINAPFQNYSTQQFLDVLQFTDRVDTVAAADQLNGAMEFLLSDLNSTQMAKLGFQRDEFIRSCLFNKMKCKYGDIELVEVPELLNCYTFNHRNQQSFQISSNLGEEYGLTMIFDVQLNEYINTILIPGVQLFIQEQIDPLMYGAMGIIMSPGLTYHISIAKFVEEKLSVPTRPCVTTNSSISNYIFSSSTYLAEGCLRSYIQDKIVDKCGCASPKYPLLTNQQNKTCNVTRAPCVMSFLQSDGYKLVGEAQQFCPTSCRSVSFKLFTTFTKLTINQPILNSLNVTATYYKKNIVTLKLYQQTDMTTIFTEKLQYDVSNILASIGGSIGCIAGMSLVSIVEIVVLIAAGIFRRCH